MKKIFLIAAAAAMVLSSCSKNSISEDNSDVNAIGFGTYSNKTKSSSTLIANGAKLTSGTSFGVYGYLTLNGTYDAAATPTPAFMPNQSVNFTEGTTDTYTYNPKRFWPKDETTKISFYAYYPYVQETAATPTAVDATTGITTSSMPNKDTEGQGSFIYTVNDTPANQVDFMVSDFVKDQSYSHTNTTTPGLVQLQFHHMLTKIGVRVKTTVDANTTIKITKITLGGKLQNSGTLTPAVDATTSAWSDKSGEKSYIIFENASGEELTAANGFVDFAPISGDLMMIPQTLSSTPLANTITIYYKYKTGEFESTDIAVADLKDQVWGMNKYIIYNVNLNNHAIEFTADVTDWDPTNVTGDNFDL